MPARKKTAKAQVPLRIVETLRARLEKSAKSRGVSMNTEIMDRIHQSFDLEDRLGGPRAARLIETMAAAMRSSGELAGFMSTGRATRKGQWLTIPYAFDQAAKAATKILDHHRPPGEVVLPRPNVVEVVAGDPKESREILRRLYADLGEFMALKEMRDREEGK